MVEFGQEGVELGGDRFRRGGSKKLGPHILEIGGVELSLSQEAWHAQSNDEDFAVLFQVLLVLGFQDLFCAKQVASISDVLKKAKKFVSSALERTDYLGVMMTVKPAIAIGAQSVLRAQVGGQHWYLLEGGLLQKSRHVSQGHMLGA